MAILKDIKFFRAGGMDTDSAIEYRAKNDFGASWNLRVTGSEQLGEGYLENIESNVRLPASLGAGINRCIGSQGFEQMGFGLGFVWNSQGAHRLLEINYSTQVVTSIDISVLNLNPQYYVDDINFIAETFLTFNDTLNPPGYINYNRLKSGGYPNITVNDFYLIKQQPPIPVSASFNNDASRSVNLLQGKGWSFRTEGIWLDYEQTAYSTISPIYYPASESTPQVGTDVTVNNNLILSINVYSDRLMQLVVAATYGGLNNWFTIETINYSDILKLPAVIDFSQQIYQAYNPATKTYSIAFYNDGLYPNIDVLQTDQLNDAVPNAAGSMAVLNGNEIILGDITTGYQRPSIAASLSAVNYNPNLTVPVNSYVPLSVIIINPGQSGSGQGNHKRLVTLEFAGVVKQNDYVVVSFVDIRNAANVLTYTLNPCTFGEQNNTQGYIFDNAPLIPYSSSYIPTDGNVAGINIVTAPYFTLLSAYPVLFNAGSGVFKSIGALKSNSSYQAALALYDHWGSPFPLDTDYTFVFKTSSYAQSHGQTPQLNWQIPSTAVVPAGAATYQWLLSPNNTHQRTLFTIASIVSYQGVWNAASNSPALSGGTTGGVGASVGWAYQVGLGGTQNLGNGPVSYPSGSYVIFNGTAWDNQPKSEGDIANPTAYYFYLNSLELFNTKNNTSVLTYSFTQGDRCTIHYSQSPGTTNPIKWYDGTNPTTNPLIDVGVLGYNTGTFLLKVNQNTAIVPSGLQGLDILLEIWTPKSRVQADATGATVLNETVFFELGTSYPIINGQFSQLRGTITQGDVYFQVVGLPSSVQPNTTQYNVLVENFNFSPYYPSAYPNFGRPRTFGDTLEVTEQVANLVYSEIYIIGSKINGLTRFYSANIYGESGGQTSSNFGRVLKMQQINLQLLILQELNHGTIPVYMSLVEDQEQQKTYAISEKILGNIRYTEGKHIGIGSTGKDSFAFYQNIAYWIDPHRSEPIRWAGNGAETISGKMSKFFKQTFQYAYALGYKIIGWYDVFNNEYLVSIQQPGGVVVNFGFNPANWQYQATYSIAPASISIISGPFHSSASYNNSTGDVLLTASSGYVGNDTLQFSFVVNGVTITKNACFGWTAGSNAVNAFAFTPLTNQALSTEVQSNFQSVTGNTIPASYSITGGQVSINGGAFISTPGTVNPGDTVQVQVLTSGSNNTLTSCTLTIDGQSATFSATTLSAGAGKYSVYSQYGVNISAVVNGTCSGTPAFSGLPLANGQIVYAVYTTTGGAGLTVKVTGTGMPAIVGHTYLGLVVNGVQVSSALYTGADDYFLTFTGTVNSPTTIQINCFTA